MIRGECINCRNSITEPICTSCLSEEVKAWLNEQKLNDNITDKINKNVLRLFGAIRILYPDSFCALCGDKTSSLCYYCTIKEINQIVKANTASLATINNWEEIFNLQAYEYGLQRV